MSGQRGRWRQATWRAQRSGGAGAEARRRASGAQPASHEHLLAHNEHTSVRGRGGRGGRDGKFGGWKNEQSKIASVAIGAVTRTSSFTASRRGDDGMERAHRPRRRAAAARHTRDDCAALPRDDCALPHVALAVCLGSESHPPLATYKPAHVKSPPDLPTPPAVDTTLCTYKKTG